ncbi:MAG: hypothetical protein ACM31C_00445 [Acidobacteriota bacterium]
MRLVIAAMVGCSSHALQPDATSTDVATDVAIDAAQPLDISATAGKDEDPALLRLADGSIQLAWFSERTGAGDIYYRRSPDGISWDAPVQVSSGPSTDVYPSVAEQPAGTLHAVWQRFDADPNTSSRIIYNRSTDGTWSAAGEQTIASGIDWSPALAVTASGALVVVFAHDPCAPSLPVCFELEVVRSLDGGATWSPPSAPALGAGGYSDTLPFLARTGDHLTLVWNRYVASTAAELPYQTPTSEVMLATTADGVTWSAPIAVTSNADYDVFPALFEDQAGAWQITWLTAPAATQVSTAVVQPVATAGAGAPDGTLPVTGYSPRAIATTVPDRYIAAWVEGTSDVDIWAQPFSR